MMCVKDFLQMFYFGVINPPIFLRKILSTIFTKEAETIKSSKIGRD